MKVFKFYALLIAAFIVFSGCSKSSGLAIRVEVYDRGTDGGKTDPADNKWTAWIKEKILQDENIIVEFVKVPRSNEDQALINLMAAGNPPDICLTYNSDNITNWAEQGGLFDVAPYIDTTLKDLKDFLGPDPALPGRDLIRRNMNAKTGQVWSMPGRRVNVARLNVFIRKDWLDILGLPVPATKDEFFNTLVAFRDRDPGNVGKDKLIPYIMNQDVRWSGGSILESFIDPDLSAKDRWVNSVVERYFLLPDYRSGVQFLNRMFNSNLIDRDFPLYRDDDIMNNLIRSGVVGSFGHNWDQIFRESERLYSDLLKNVPTAEWVTVDCMTSSDGITHKISYDPAGVNYFIPKSSKNPDAAMRYLNWLSKYENYHFIQIGPEGVVHTVVDGIPKLNPAAEGGWIQNSAQNIDYTPIMNGLFMRTEEESIKALANAYPWPAGMIMDAYKTATANARPGPVIIPSSPLVVAGPLSQTLQDKAKDMLVQAIIAPLQQFNNTWDRSLKDWQDSGAQAIRDERLEKYQ
jgi:putative aldouronate transport system substrate-binding protein